jgi:hypothetical protein
MFGAGPALSHHRCFNTGDYKYMAVQTLLATLYQWVSDLVIYDLCSYCSTSGVYKNRKNAWIDSENFRGPKNFRIIRHFDHLSIPFRSRNRDPVVVLFPFYGLIDEMSYSILCSNNPFTFIFCALSLLTPYATSKPFYFGLPNMAVLLQHFIFSTLMSRAPNYSVVETA